MSYKTTRIYDFKLLDRHIDFDSLVDSAIASLTEFAQENDIQGYVGCTLDLVYPDLTLVEDSKGGWNNRVERLTEKVHKRFAEVDWEITNLRSNLFGVLDYAHGTLPHKITTAVRRGKYQLKRSIEVSVPYDPAISYQAVVIVLRVLLKMITPDWFQYADSAILTTWATTLQSIDEVVISSEVGKKVPWKHWLRKDTAEDAIEYFQTPGITEAIVKECKGYYMNADKAEKGERTVRRYLYDSGQKEPMEVNTPMDLRNLVEEKGFYAFYSSCETRDGDVGKVCIDLDARWMLQTLLGPADTWALECALIDGILELTAQIGWPSPAIKFSGSRGIHAYWLIEKGAVGDEWIDIEPYEKTVLRIDKDIMKKKTTESFMRPFGGVKTLFQAMVLRAKYQHMDWSKVPLSSGTMEALGIQSPEQLITVGPLEDRFMTKMGVDIISQKKGVFRTVLSPHFKSGLVSRNIGNQFGQIGSEFRVWRFMRKLASREQVMEDMLTDHRSMQSNPGTLRYEHLESLAEILRGDVSMLIRFSPGNASGLVPTKYQLYEERYAKLHDYQQWRPWSSD